MSLGQMVNRRKNAMTTELATTRNLKDLLSLERECFTADAYTEKQIADLLNTPNVVALFSRVNNDVAGFIIGLIEDFRGIRLGHILTLDVGIKHRRKGIGLTLLKEVERVFSQSNVQVIYLEVRAGNRPALRLYRKRGFAEKEFLEDYYSAGAHGLRLLKRLRPKSSDSS